MEAGYHMVLAQTLLTFCVAISSLFDFDEFQ